MTLITINDKKVTSEIQTENTINDVMNMILDDCTNEHEVITNVMIDGNELDVTDESLVNKIQQYEHIDFTTKSTLELAFEAITSCYDYIDIIISRINKTVDFFKANDLQPANEQFAELIDIIDLFIQLQSQINVVLKERYSRQYSKNESMQQIELHLVATLKSLIPAKENNDIVMLCDLLEYELIDNLVQWKSKILPIQEKIGNN